MFFSLLLVVQCILAAAQAADITTLPNYVQSIAQSLKTTQTATFNMEFVSGGRRVFKIDRMVCTVAVGEKQISCFGGTLAIGAPGVAPELNIENSTLTYHAGSPGHITGIVNAKANIWNKYNFDLNSVHGQVSFDSTGINKVHIKGSGSLDAAPRFQLDDVELEAIYERGSATRLSGKMTLKAGKQNVANSLPPLEITATSTLGTDTSPDLVMRGTATAAWKPLGNDGPSVDKLNIEARLTNAGLASVKVGPFQFRYDISVTMPSSISPPTCSYSYNSYNWGRRQMLFSSAPSNNAMPSNNDFVDQIHDFVDQTDLIGRGISGPSLSFSAGGYTFTCGLTVVTTTSTLKANAAGTFNLDLVTLKAWGSLDLTISGTLGGVAVNVAQDLFPYPNSNQPLNITDIFGKSGSGDISLCGLMPSSVKASIKDLAVTIPTVNSRDLVPNGLAIPTGLWAYPTYTINKDDVPSFTAFSGRTIKLGNGVDVCSTSV